MIRNLWTGTVPTFKDRLTRRAGFTQTCTSHTVALVKLHPSGIQKKQLYTEGRDRCTLKVTSQRASNTHTTYRCLWRHLRWADAVFRESLTWISGRIFYFWLSLKHVSFLTWGNEDNPRHALPGTYWLHATRAHSPSRSPRACVQVVRGAPARSAGCAQQEVTLQGLTSTQPSCTVSSKFLLERQRFSSERLVRKTTLLQSDLHFPEEWVYTKSVICSLVPHQSLKDTLVTIVTITITGWAC